MMRVLLRSNLLLYTLLSVAPGRVCADERPSFKFDFGPGDVESGYTRVLPGLVYRQERGYGFEPTSDIDGVDRRSEDALRRDFCTSDEPFYFSVAVPEGNYRITVLLGDAAGESMTTVKAELRRLMLERLETGHGEFATRTFVVNVRTPKIAGDGEVRLKDREKSTEKWAWDGKLTLEFNDAQPRLCAMEVVPVDDVPTVFLLGDSTVCDQPLEPYASWGQMLPRFFGPDVAVANHAESGESLRSSLGAGRLEKVLSVMKRGDYLFLQYGHNDMKSVDEDNYKSTLKRFVVATRERGGNVVLVTSMHRRTFGGSEITNSLRGFPDAVREVAKEEALPLIDLHTMSKALYEALGPTDSAVLFKDGDRTHHNNYGSYQLARCVVEGIRKSKLELAKFLLDAGSRFDPAKPDASDDFKLPASPLRN